MRVALIIYGSLDVLSGGNLYDRKLVEHLRERGHEVGRIELPAGSYARRLLQNLSRSLRSRISKGRYDVVLQDELAHPSLFRLNRVVRPRLSSPFVGIVHHLLSSEERAQWKNQLFRGFEKSYLASLDAFVFNSETTRESVESLLGKKTRSVVATPGGDRFAVRLSPRELLERARRGGPVRLLFVGNLISRKGLHHLLEALRELSPETWRLDVVGALDMDRDYAARLGRRIRELGLQDRITLHGRLDGERLIELYRDSQVFVLPSSYEGFGIVYLEAMSFGLPVVAGASGATDEIVRHEVTGFLVNPADRRSVQLPIERLIADRDLLARVSLAADEDFTRHSTWEQSMTAIESFLSQLVPGAASQRASTESREDRLPPGGRPAPG